MRVLLTLPIALAMTGCAFVSPTQVDEQKATFDADGDGAVSAASGGDDCDDTDPAVGPGATEVCNGIDDNCDGAVDEELTSLVYADADGDGVGAGEVVELCNDELDDGWVSIDGDCDDDDERLAPGNDELPCDGLDNDCDGSADNVDASATFYVDADNDGFGDPTMPVLSCDGGANLVANGDDCDDTDQLVHPNAQEWCDYIDNNCDSQVDNDAVDERSWFEDADADGIGGPNFTNACEPPAGSNPWIELFGDCDDTDPTIYPGAQELCDSKDNDCDGQFDEETPNWWPDADGDGFGDEGAPATANCVAPDDTVSNSSDCNDGDPLTFPGSDEVCGGADEDCDGTTDEDDAIDAPDWYTDADADAYGDPSTAVASCTNPGGLVSNGDDCDDNDIAVNPDTVWFLDDDGDTFGDPDVSVTVCIPPAKHLLDNQDCDDTDSAVHPDATEVCDTIDNDCDGGTDVGLTTPFYIDSDDDGFGDSSDSVDACSAPTGRVADDSDCDDSLNYVHPGATEACDDVSDYNCDTEVDWDRDGDGYSDVNCPPGGGSDCLDSDDQVFPGQGCAEPDCWAWLHEQGETADGIYDIDPDGPGGSNAPFPVYCDMTRNGGGWTLIFEDLFDTGADPGWNNTTTTTCDGDIVLGGFDEFGNGHNRNIDIDMLGVAHDVVWFESSFIQIDSWDGEDHWIEVDGTEIWRDRWHHRDGASHRCGADNTNSWREVDWPQSWMFSHAATDTLGFRYQIEANGEGASNESAGIDSVAIWVNRFPSADPGSSDTNPALSCAHVLAANGAAGNGDYWLDVDGPGPAVPAQFACNMTEGGGGWTVLLDDDMSPPDPAWSMTTTSTCTGGWGEMLGGEGLSGQNAPIDIEVDTLGIAHSEVRVEWDFIFVDNWEASDDGFLDIEGNQRWRGDQVSGSSNICGSGSGNDGRTTDIVRTHPHGRPEVTLRFRSNTNNGLADEPFAIDNVEVWIR